MYEFVSGPLVWIAFIVFFGGSAYQLVTMHKMAKKEKVIYPYMSLKYGLRSIVHWIVPFASTNMRKRPIMTVVTFAFHLCLILTPLFLLSHNILWYQSWKISWWTLPENVADIMTVIVIVASVFFLMRRLILSEVRFVSFASDYLLLAVAVAPFLTGFIAYHQWLHYKTMLTLHILSGEVMLMAIPFTRLSHMLFFVFTRAFMGSEFGSVRNSKDW
ncbi:MAG: nitrate reductase [Thermodesulfobacteriota bacterium]|nr:nitrate reductase [Thermodesulfobacteriota bacterium]